MKPVAAVVELAVPRAFIRLPTETERPGDGPLHLDQHVGQRTLALSALRFA